MAQIELFRPDERIRVETEASLDEDYAKVNFYSSPVKSAEVYIDRSYAGRTAYSCRLEPGSHYLELSAPGYYPLGTWMLLAAKTSYSLSFELQRITGYLNVAVEPADAALSLDGESIPSGTSAQEAGPHRLVARRFGYEQKELPVFVPARATATASISLEKSAFAIEGYGFSRKSFNPRNAGASGRTSLDFKASSYGSGHVEIKDASGTIVASLDFPDFESWNQSASWDGRGSDGAPLPDGIYTASLVALPAAGVPVQREGRGEGGQSVEADGSILATASATIDSSLVIRPIGTASAVSGLLYMPEPCIESAGAMATEAFWFSPLSSLGDSAFGIAASFSLGGIAALGLHASAELDSGSGSSSLSAGALAASASLRLFGDRTSAFGGALFLRGSYASSAAPSMPGADSGIEASLPLGAALVDLGGLGSGLDIRLALSPGALLDYSAASPAYRLQGRAALWLEGSAFKAGFSGELPFSFASGLAPDWPAHLAAEARLMLGSSPFVAAAYATADLSPDAAPSYGLGLGLGLLF